MIVVSDTSVIGNLFMVDKLHLLNALFEKVIIPDKVADELTALETFGYNVDNIFQAEIISVRSVKNREKVESLLEELDPGESEAIVLALELDIPLLLIDEKKGRAKAEELGIDVTGLLGILLRAKAKGSIPALKPIVDSLISDAKFFISDKLYKAVLLKAGED